MRSEKVNSVEGLSCKRDFKDYALISIKGVFMGAADVVPGVSGGTVALITGIYEELLNSLKNLGPGSLLVWKKQGFKAFWEHTNAAFLLALFVGIALSIKTLAAGIAYALEHYPILVWSLFSGLILSSFGVLFKQHRALCFSDIVLFIVGAALVVGIALITPTVLPASPLIVFMGGFIAISAMILPGISGSFILLLVGLYPVILGAVENVDLSLLASFLVGCTCGLLVFSRFLSWLLNRFYDYTLALMMGFLVGSIFVTWPWKHTVLTRIDRHGELVPLKQVNVSPEVFTELSGLNAQVWLALIAFAIGICLVLLVDLFFNRASKV